MVKVYDEELMARLREVKHAGLPLSLLVLATDRNPYREGASEVRLMMAGCSDEAVYMWGKTNRFDAALGYGPSTVQHWIKDGGWMIDPLACWMVDADLFYEIEQPEVLGQRTKQQCLDFEEGLSKLDDDLDLPVPSDADELFLNVTMIIPSLEAQALSGKFMDSERFLSELQLWKDSIENYAALESQFAQTLRTP